MPKQLTKRGELVREYCRKWPRHGSMTLAKAIYKKHPDLWTSVHSVRLAVSHARGNRGSASRGKNKIAKDLIRPCGASGAPEPTLPRSVAPVWTPYELPVGVKTAVLSDIHVPYHSDEALGVALKDVQKYEPDVILLNGDICDFFGCSRWDRDPRQVRLEREIDLTRALFAYIRSKFPKAEIIWKEGNHEERFHHFLWKKAPEFLNVDSFDLDTIFQLDKHGITRVGDQRIIMAGKLPILHGHEFPKGMINPVNQARGMFLRGIECCLAGHGHRSSEHSEPTMLGRLITCWSTGCLCDLTPEYARLNKWSHGYALVETNSEGAFTVGNKRIYRGRSW